MSKVIWHKGPPPSIGWWPASTARHLDMFRWWDGKYWSIPLRSLDSRKDAGTRAKSTEYQCFQSGIEWRNWPANWPERSRT